MDNSYLFTKKGLLFTATFSAIVIFTVLILLGGGGNFYWLALLAVLIILQLNFKVSAANLFPLVAVLALTEYYFLFSGKRVYLCEMVYIPLLINYFLTDFFIKPLNYNKVIVLSLVLALFIFQVINFLINSNLTSSFFRIRTLALPLFLICMVDSQIKDKKDLKRVINIILFVSFLATLIVYLQFLTGNFYVLQNGIDTSDDSNFVDFYLNYTQDSFLFSLIGLHIKGPMPPVGLNYFKFGYSEKIIVAVSLLFSLYKFERSKKKYRHLLLFLLLCFATLLTGSRSILLSFLFVAVIIHLFYKRKLKWGFILFIILSFFSVIYLIGPLLSFIQLEEFGTLASRMFYMDDFFRYVQAHPAALFAGSYPEHFMEITGAAQPPHHFFAFGIIADGLIITLVLFVLVYKVLKTTRTLNTKDNELLAIGYGLWASFFSFVFIYGQTSYLTWSTPHNMFFCIVLGLLLATYRLSKNQLVDLNNSIGVR